MANGNETKSGPSFGPGSMGTPKNHGTGAFDLLRAPNTKMNRARERARGTWERDEPLQTVEKGKSVAWD